jgi:hypothetical protein
MEDRIRRSDESSQFNTMRILQFVANVWSLISLCLFILWFVDALVKAPTAEKFSDENNDPFEDQIERHRKP